MGIGNYSYAAADWLLSYSSFQIIVEVNYAIVIVTLSDWLNHLTPVFQQWETKPKPIAPCTSDVSHALRKVQVILGILIGLLRCLPLYWHHTAIVLYST